MTHGEMTEVEQLRQALTQIASGERVMGEVSHRSRFGNPEGAADPPTVRVLRPYEIARRALAEERGVVPTAWVLSEEYL